MEETLRGFRARTILDVGPGYANFGRVAARITGAAKITYLDYNETILTWQKNACEKAGIAAESMTMLLNPDNLFRLSAMYDLILCQEVLEHLADAEAVLTRLAEHLAPAGRMVVTVPTKCSERWLKRLNPSYMRDEPQGHVREFDRRDIEAILAAASLRPLVLIPTQPHFFLSHAWLALTRMKLDGATGKVLTGGIRYRLWGILNEYSRRFFLLTGPDWWGRLLPRNYFVVAVKAAAADAALEVTP